MFYRSFRDVLACNGMDVKVPMGNIRETSFEDIWNSDQAGRVRQIVRTCQKQCWMVGSAAPAIKNILVNPLSGY